MISSHFLIPTHDNEGNRFGRDAWLAFEETLTDAFGGFSGPALVNGAWRGEDGRMYRDRSRRYDIALQSWWQSLRC